MNGGGGGRQLPSWMLRQCTVDKTSNSEVKQQNDSDAVDDKTSQTQKKVKRKHNSEVPLLENKSHVLAKCEVGTRDIKLSHQEADQHDEKPYLLKLGRTVKRKKTNKRGNDQEYDLPKSNLGADDGSMRKRCRSNSSGKKKKKKKTGVSVEGSYDGAVPSEDELTVEDLVSIAEEYVRADIKEPEYLQLDSKMRSEKDLTPQKKDMKPHTHNPLSTKSVLTNPLCSGESIVYPVSTGDPAQDMLDLLLGGFLKKSKEAERKNDAITKNIILDHDVSRRSQYDTVGEVVPVVRKKASLKEKVAKLLG